MKIHHTPLLEESAVAQQLWGLTLSEWSYVCTTETLSERMLSDIYFSSTGEYMAVYLQSNELKYIPLENEEVESMLFAMVVGDFARYEYSTSLRDRKRFQNGNFIEGGRIQPQGGAEVELFALSQGHFIPIEVR